VLGDIPAAEMGLGKRKVVNNNCEDKSQSFVSEVNKTSLQLERRAHLYTTIEGRGKRATSRELRPRRKRCLSLVGRGLIAYNMGPEVHLIAYADIHSAD
jgi:nucleosome binding factor SPN SPT16 subunit